MSATSKRRVVAVKVKLPTSIKVKGLQNAAGLKLCLVALFDDRIAEIAKRLAISEKKVIEQGKVALALTAKDCFFCGSDKGTKKLPFPNREDVLCPCLKHLRSGYRELRAGWKEEVAKATEGLPLPKKDGTGKTEIPTPAMKAAWLKASSDLLRVFNGAKTPLYSNQCVSSGCRTAFVIDSGMVTGAVRGYGKYLHSTKCEECRAKTRAEKAAKKISAAPVATTVAQPPVASHGAKPTKKMKKVREYERPIPPEVAERNSLEVSLGELLQNKKAQA